MKRTFPVLKIVRRIARATAKLPIAEQRHKVNYYTEVLYERLSC